jgi:hypothetical protein
MREPVSVAAVQGAPHPSCRTFGRVLRSASISSGPAPPLEYLGEPGLLAHYASGSPFWLSSSPRRLSAALVTSSGTSV